MSSYLNDVTFQHLHFSVVHILTLRFLLYAFPLLAHFILETNVVYFDTMNATRLTFSYSVSKCSNCSLGHWLGPGRFSWTSSSTLAGGDPYIKIYI